MHALCTNVRADLSSDKVSKQNDHKMFKIVWAFVKRNKFNVILWQNVFIFIYSYVECQKRFDTSVSMLSIVQRVNTRSEPRLRIWEHHPPPLYVRYLFHIYNHTSFKFHETHIINYVIMLVHAWMLCESTLQWEWFAFYYFLTLLLSFHVMLECLTITHLLLTNRWK